MVRTANERKPAPGNKWRISLFAVSFHLRFFPKVSTTENAWKKKNTVTYGTKLF